MENIKFDPSQWKEYGPNTPIKITAQTVIQMVEPGAVYLIEGKKARIVYYGTRVKLTLPDGEHTVTCSVESSVNKGAKPKLESKGVPLTNFDKRPGQSQLEAMFGKVQREALVDQALRKHAARMENVQLMQERARKGLETKTVEQPKPKEEEEEEEGETTSEIVKKEEKAQEKTE